jgi:hypothetical protein
MSNRRRDSKGRLLTNRIPSDEIQGEGSWVGFRRHLKLKHLRAVAEMATFAGVDFEEDPVEALDAFQRIGVVMSNVVLTWNWTDEHGDPLPQPGDRPEVFEELGFDELMWLIDAMARAVGATSNPKVKQH